MFIGHEIEIWFWEWFDTNKIKVQLDVDSLSEKSFIQRREM